VKDGFWICRSCWKKNGLRDAKCYRCKAPRDPEIDAAVPATFAGPGASLPAPSRRMDAGLPFLVLLVSVPMWISGAAFYLVAALLVVTAVLSFMTVNIPGVIGSVIGALLAVPFGMLFMFISRRVRRHQRWAYIVAALFYIVPSAPTLLGLIDTPRPADVPDWFGWVLLAETVFSAIYAILGIAAIFLLTLSFVPSDGEGVTASPEAG
jgi:hypothetical protein